MRRTVIYNIISYLRLFYSVRFVGTCLDNLYRVGLIPNCSASFPRSIESSAESGLALTAGGGPVRPDLAASLGYYIAVVGSAALS